MLPKFIWTEKCGYKAILLYSQVPELTNFKQYLIAHYMRQKKG